MNSWWKQNIVYQIYPRSFNDSNGDGIGDIPGIIEKLDYLQQLGIGVIWLSPVYKSPNEDNGYDISDYQDINPEYGTMEDMDNLIAEAKNRGIRIIMDLVINHTSSEHSWFQKSREGIEPYNDYYIWKDNPNNWTSFFGGDAWEYDEKRKQYYLHLFAKGQPDLNYYNPKVIDEVKRIMDFWLAKGIAGFRCGVINILYKDSLEDGKHSLVLTGKEHYLTTDRTHDILKELRKDILDNYDCFTVGETVLVNEKQAKNLSDENRRELNMIFTFEHLEVDNYFVKWFPKKFKPKLFFKSIAKWIDTLEWSANFLECHDQPRSVSRFGDTEKYHNKSAKMLATMLLTLRGTPFIYQGQEIGMTNFDYESLDDIEDVETHNIMKLAKRLHIPKLYRWKMIKHGSRDNARTPMQWSGKAHGGFTQGTPWLKANNNYANINAQQQNDDRDSILNYYKKLIALRRESDILNFGAFVPVKMSKRVFIYKRELEGRCITVALNFSNKAVKYKQAGDILLSNYSENTNGVLREYQAIIIKEGMEDRDD